MAAQDYYDILGVDKGSSQSDIKKKYYQLAKQYHPDANPGDKAAEEKFAEISAAYDTLGDESTRAQYDSTGGQPGFDGFGGFGGQQNPEDIFNNIFGGFGKQQRGGNSPRRGADIQYAMEITFDDAVTGVTRKLNYENKLNCDDCNGSGAKPGANSRGTCHVCNGSGVEMMEMGGFIQYQSTCRKCGGTGSIITSPCTGCRGRGYKNENTQVDVDIPAGVEDGMELRLLNKGHAGENGGPPGSLYVVLKVQRSRHFDREGPNVSSSVNISLAQAILGGKITVKGVQGDMKLKVNAGTQSGTQTRLKGRGMPRVKSTSRGDHYVRFNIDVPKTLTRKQKELMLEWSLEEKNRKGSVSGLDDFIEQQQQQQQQQQQESVGEKGGKSWCDDDDSTVTESEGGGFFESIFGSSKKDKDTKTEASKKEAKEQNGQ